MYLFCILVELTTLDDSLGQRYDGEDAEEVDDAEGRKEGGKSCCGRHPACPGSLEVRIP